MDDTNACKSLDMASVADLMDGRFLHTLICLALEQTFKEFEGRLLHILICLGLEQTFKGLEGML